MSHAERPDELTTLWRPVGQAELDLVAASGWRAWPPRLPGQPIFYPVLNRWYATKITREWNVPREGTGYVTRFQVPGSFLSQFDIQQAGGRDVLEYWIPAEQLPEFNASIAGPIIEEARYHGPVSDQDFTGTDAATGPLPQAWRAYLQGPSWFRRGWMTTGDFVDLLPPADSLEITNAWKGTAERFPGLQILGTDRSRELIVTDARDASQQILLADITCAGWQDAIPQGCDVVRFIERVDAGTFGFTF